MHKHKHNTYQHLPEQHLPVLLEPVLEYLDPRSGERYLDLTAGYGGHAAAILDRTGLKSRHLLIDRDEEAVKFLQRKFAGQNIDIVHSDFESALRKLDGEFDVVLADVGVSSPQLDNFDRGFSFRESGALDMRMDQSQEKTAADIVNTMSEHELADLIYAYGEERQSRRIARALVEQRPFTTTEQLATVVRRAYRGKSRIHPATRTFQALRVAVNDELGQLQRSLPLIERILTPGGRVGIISFHSLEDRIVKQFFRSSSLESLHKKVIQGSQEDVSNPRARSAKLRAAMKNKNGHVSSLNSEETQKQTGGNHGH